MAILEVTGLKKIYTTRFGGSRVLVLYGGGSAVNRRCPLFFWRKMEYNIRIRNNGDD